MCPTRNAHSLSAHPPATAVTGAGTYLSRSRCAERTPAAYGSDRSGHACVQLAMRTAHTRRRRW